MKNKFTSQSGQAIIYVVILGASVLGAALIANQNILVDVLRTRKIENANVAYYSAEAALEESLLDIKQKGYNTKDIKATKLGNQNSSISFAPASDQIDLKELSSSQLLPETNGVLKKDQSLNITIPEEWKSETAISPLQERNASKTD